MEISVDCGYLLRIHAKPEKSKNQQKRKLTTFKVNLRKRILSINNIHLSKHKVYQE